MGIARRSLTRLCYRAGRLGDRIARTSHYLAVGTLPLCEMQESIRRGWDSFYEADHDVPDGFLSWERDLIERVVPTDGRVLLIGCGSGRDLLAFLDRGCTVVGVDPSAPAIEAARRRLAGDGRSAALLEGFFEEVDARGPFDVVVFSYHCYATIPQSRRRIAALRKAAALLTRRGCIILSHSTTRVPPRRALIACANFVGVLCRTDWRLEAGDVVWENRAVEASWSFTHVFQDGEVDREADRAGLCVRCQADGPETHAVALVRR